MYQTALELAPLCSLHLVILLDHDYERWHHWELEEKASSVEYLTRMEGQPKEFGSILPFAVREFANANLEWLIHREIYLRQVDVVQLEYTALGQYLAPSAWRKSLSGVLDGPATPIFWNIDKSE